MSLASYSLLQNQERLALCTQLFGNAWDFGTGDPKDPMAPFLLEALKLSIPEVSQYPPSLGSPELRNAACGWLQRHLGVAAEPGNIVSTNGSKEAIFHTPLALAELLRPGILYPDPGYPVYLSGAKAARIPAFPVALPPDRDFLLAPGDLPCGWSGGALWVCSPHNPTGAALDWAALEAVYDWAQKAGTVLLSDECYVDLAPPNTPSLLQVSRDRGYAGVLAYFSLSKRSGMTGLRTGFLTGDPLLVGLQKRFRPHAGLGTPTFIQGAAAAAWEDDAHVLDRQKAFRSRREVVEAALGRLGLTWCPSQSAIYVWVRAPQDFPSGDAYADWLAREAGIVVTPGSAFGVSCPQWFRIALVPTLEDTSAAMEAWERAGSQ